MLENRFCKIEYVVDRWCEAAVEQRAGAHRKHQRLAGARAGAPGDMFGAFAARAEGRTVTDVVSALKARIG